MNDNDVTANTDNDDDKMVALMPGPSIDPTKGSDVM